MPPTMSTGNCRPASLVRESVRESDHPDVALVTAFVGFGVAVADECGDSDLLASSADELGDLLHGHAESAGAVDLDDQITDPEPVLLGLLVGEAAGVRIVCVRCFSVGDT